MEAWYFGKFGLDPEARGFNAGIFALRPADHRDLAERFESLLAEQDAMKQPFAFDQGLLNGLLLNGANILPAEFNAHCLGECGVPKGVRAIHYTGSPKPWANGYDRATEGYLHWLEANGASATELAAVKRGVLLAKPGRFAKRAVRKIATMLKLTDTEMGVGRRPDAP
jgi:lipopolysaccharide biosynthesis glycosyltransferase